MDIAATILAGLTILSVPFLWWFGAKARASREQEIARIKALVEERSRMLEDRSRMLEGRSRELSELHSRLDALDEQDSQRESMAGEELINQMWPATSVLHKAISEREAALERHYVILERHLNVRDVALKYYLPALEPTDLQPAYRIYRHWLKEAETDPEWLKAADPHEPVGIFGFRRKSGSRRRSQGPLQGPALQSS